MLLSKTLGTFFCVTALLPFMTARALFSQSASGVPTPSISLPGTQSPFLGSEPEGKASGTVLQIDLRDAIDRGLRNNLGLLIAGDQTLQARGERWKELSNLLPNFSAGIRENVQTQSLTALGLKSNVFPFPIPRVIGPFNYFDMRANFSQSLFNFHDLEKERAASESLKASQYTY
jgi:outer membrane protein TolC